MIDLPFLQVQPVSDGYQLGFGDNVLSARLDGPASFQREGYAGAARVAAVTWILSPYQYDYFKAFWRATLQRGVLPFEIELVSNVAVPERYAALFIPGTVKLTSFAGMRYTVNAQVEVTRAPSSVDLGEMFAVLERLVNVTMPEHIG